MSLRRDIDILLFQECFIHLGQILHLEMRIFLFHVYLLYVVTYFSQRYTMMKIVIVLFMQLWSLEFSCLLWIVSKHLMWYLASCETRSFPLNFASKLVSPISIAYNFNLGPIVNVCTCLRFVNLSSSLQIKHLIASMQLLLPIFLLDTFFIFTRARVIIFKIFPFPAKLSFIIPCLARFVQWKQER